MIKVNLFALVLGAFVLFQMPASAQDYANAIVIDPQTANAIELAAARDFNGHIPNMPVLTATKVLVEKRDADYLVTILTQAATREVQTGSFQVNPLTKAVQRVATFQKATSAAVSVPGIYAAALVLSESAFATSRSPLKPTGDINVKLSAPYGNLPNYVFVFHLPRRIDITKAPPGQVILGCSPGIGFGVDVSKQTITPAAPVC